MAKTIVAARHEAGPAKNGHDGCHARWGNAGLCPGAQTATWLNALGEDEEPYCGSTRITNGQVRDNYLNGEWHVVAVDPALACLRAEERRTAAALRGVRRRIKDLEKAAGTQAGQSC